MRDELTVTQAAALLGKPDSTVGDWCQQGLPSKKSGRNRVIRVRDLLRWLAGRDAQPGSERERLAKEQADRVALDNAKKRGELIYAWQVADVLNTMAATLSAQLDSLPGRVAGELAGMTDAADIRALLLRETRAIRSSMAEHVGKLAEAAERAAS